MKSLPNCTIIYLENRPQEAIWPNHPQIPCSKQGHLCKSKYFALQRIFNIYPTNVYFSHLSWGQHFWSVKISNFEKFETISSKPYLAITNDVLSFFSSLKMLLKILKEYIEILLIIITIITDKNLCISVAVDLITATLVFSLTLLYFFFIFIIGYITSNNPFHSWFP